MSNKNLPRIIYDLPSNQSSPRGITMDKYQRNVRPSRTRPGQLYNLSTFNPPNSSPAQSSPARSSWGEPSEKSRSEVESLDTYKTVFIRPDEKHAPPRQFPLSYGQRYAELDTSRTTTRSIGGRSISISSSLSTKRPPPAQVSVFSPITPTSEFTDSFTKYEVVRTGPRRRSIWGLPPKVFWPLLAILVLLVTGGIVGGVFASILLKRKNAKPTSPNNPTLGSALPKKALTAHSPQPGTSIATIQYVRDKSKSPSDADSTHLFYQENDGNIQEIAWNSPLTGWEKSRPIFTDARNFSGLAAFSRMNVTQRWSHIFYISSDNILQEKRLAPDNPVWLPAVKRLGDLKAQTNASSSTSTDNGGLQLAVAYSDNFKTGPGARLFYHTADFNGNPFVQELIWVASSDTWSAGQKIFDPDPSSQLAATVDGTKLRLFYSTSDKVLQESYLDISQAQASYKIGVRQPNSMFKANSPISAVTVQSSTLVFFQSSISEIKQLNVTGVANNTPGGSSASVSPSTVATIESSSDIVSIGSAYSMARPQINVFYTDQLLDAPNESTSVGMVYTARVPQAQQWPTFPSVLSNVRAFGGVSGWDN